MFVNYTVLGLKIKLNLLSLARQWHLECNAKLWFHKWLLGLPKVLVRRFSFGDYFNNSKSKTSGEVRISEDVLDIILDTWFISDLGFEFNVVYARFFAPFMAFPIVWLTKAVTIPNLWTVVILSGKGECTIIKGINWHCV